MKVKQSSDVSIGLTTFDDQVSPLLSKSKVEWASLYFGRFSTFQPFHSVLCLVQESFLVTSCNCPIQGFWLQKRKMTVTGHKTRHNASKLIQWSKSTSVCGHRCNSGYTINQTPCCEMHGDRQSKQGMPVQLIQQLHFISQRFTSAACLLLCLHSRERHTTQLPRRLTRAAANHSDMLLRCGWVNIACLELSSCRSSKYMAMQWHGAPVPLTSVYKYVCGRGWEGGGCFASTAQVERVWGRLSMMNVNRWYSMSRTA